MNRLHSIFSTAVFVTCFCVATIHAADIQVGVSSNDAYVGFPIVLQVRIDNASKHEAPEIEGVDGLKIESMGNPSQSQRVMNINGRVTSTTSSVYQWRVTPSREGTFTIPPIPIRADGISSITKAVRIKATKSDAGDLLIAEIEGNQDSVYVGEPIELSLKIYVKAYIDEEANIKLSDGSMWGLLSEQTQWGVFDESIQQMTMNRMQPRGIEVIRKDTDGKDTTYYRYQVDARLFPSRPGPVDLEGVKIGFEYPLEISKPDPRRRSRSSFESILGDDFPFSGSVFGDSFFGGGASTRRITKSMPLMVVPELNSVVAKAIPTETQPKEFAGAVGRYVIESFTSDKSVQAGDPIELTIRIHGTGQMDTIAAPPLSLIEALTENFKVNNQPLAGQVDRDQKVFTTTIRPKNERVTEIPAIPFSYFDPASGEYETSYSEPIPINVTPAETLKLDRAVRVDKEVPNKQNAESKTAVNKSKPQLNLAWRDLVENKDRTKIDLINIMIPSLVLPPFIFLVGVLMRGYVAINHRSASESKTLRKIKSADRVSEIAVAMSSYFARRWKVPTPDLIEGDLSMDHILGHLRSVGLHRFAVRVEKWMDQSTQNHVTPDAELESLRLSAIEIIKDAKLQRKMPSRRAVSALIAFGFIAGAGGHATAVEPSPTETPASKSRTLLEQAESDYRTGDFVSSASLLNSVKSELPANTELYVNLGNAWWQSGKTARSKASFLQALEIDPTDDIARQNLLAVEDSSWLLQQSSAPPMRLVLLLAVVAWAALWATLTLQLWTRRLWVVAFPWRSIAAICMLITLVAGGIAALQISCVRFPHHAVIVTDDVNLRSGDGETFDVIQTITDASGKVVRWTAKRPGWIQVVTTEGETGWLPEGTVEIVSG